MSRLGRVMLAGRTGLGFNMAWRQLEALGGACEERSRTSAVLGLAEVAERDHELVRVRRREDLLEVVAPEEPVSKQGCNTKAPAQTERLIC